MLMYFTGMLLGALLGYSFCRCEMIVSERRGAEKGE